LPKADKLQGSLDLLVLKVLSRRPNIHGYAIISAVREISQNALQIEDGSLYPALHRMEEAGWIKAKWITKETGSPSRVYELAAAGRKQLASEEVRWRNVTFAIDRVLRMV
jgi:transcriptional regulator